MNVPDNKGKTDAIKISNFAGHLLSEIKSYQKHNKDVITHTRMEKFYKLHNRVVSKARDRGDIDGALQSLEAMLNERNRMLRDMADSKDWKSVKGKFE